MEEVALGVLKFIGFILLLAVGSPAVVVLLAAPPFLIMEHWDYHPGPPTNYIGEAISLVVFLTSFLLLYLYVPDINWWSEVVLSYVWLLSWQWLYLAWGERLKPVCSERIYAFLGWTWGAILFVLYTSLKMKYGGE